MKNLTPMKAIRKKCLDCCCYQPKEVTLCTVTNCLLYAFRTGHRPKRDNYTNAESYIEKTHVQRQKTKKKGTERKLLICTR